MSRRIVPSIFVAVTLAMVALLFVVTFRCYAETPSAPPCCPQCGCHDGLIPVCHPYWTTKKETKYHYCCQCEPICIPDQCPCCSKSGCENGNCADTNCCNDIGGCDGGKCNCLIIAQHKLVKFAYTVETPVCKCKIDWVCPHCGCNCGIAAEDEKPCPANSSLPTPPMPPKLASTESNSRTTPVHYTAAEKSDMLSIPVNLAGPK